MLDSSSKTDNRTGEPTTAAVRRRQSGQALVELALVIPIALLLVAGAIDAGRLFFTKVSIENAAREGAVFAMGNPLCDTSDRTPCDDPNTADWHVRNEASGLGPLATAYTCSTLLADSETWAPRPITECTEGDRYAVDVSTDFSFLMPILVPVFGESIELRATATSIILNESYDPAATPIPWPTPTPTPPPCTVPNMIDLTRAEAEAAWVGAGFDAENLSAEPPDMGAVEVVLGQGPPAGEELVCGDGEVTVSASA